MNNLWEPLEVMQRVMELGKIAAEDAYLYWNMGNGMLLVVEESQADNVLQLAEKEGYHARKAGYITEKSDILIECGTVQLKYEY
jgi:phosphoribosylformylglycinamidine cyclo-ligase